MDMGTVMGMDTDMEPIPTATTKKLHCPGGRGLLKLKNKFSRLQAPGSPKNYIE